MRITINCLRSNPANQFHYSEVKREAGTLHPKRFADTHTHTAIELRQPLRTRYFRWRTLGPRKRENRAPFQARMREDRTRVCSAGRGVFCRLASGAVDALLFQISANFVWTQSAFTAEYEIVVFTSR